MERTYSDGASVAEQPEDEFETARPETSEGVECTPPIALDEQHGTSDVLVSGTSTMEGIVTDATVYPRTLETFIDVFRCELELNSMLSPRFDRRSSRGEGELAAWRGLSDWRSGSDQVDAFHRAFVVATDRTGAIRRWRASDSVGWVVTACGGTTGIPEFT
jgi:hypothetical protein